MKTLISIFLTVATVFGLQAQERGITVTDLRMNETGDALKVNFTAQIGERAARAGYALVATPVIVEGAVTRDLPSLVVMGRKARVAARRNDMQIADNIYTTVSNGAQVQYQTTVPVSTLKPGTELIIRTVMKGCCSELASDPTLLAEKFVRVRQVEEQREVVTMEPYTIETTGDKLSKHKPYIAAGTDFGNQGAKDAEEFVRENRKNGVTVFYRVGSQKLETGYRENATVLRDIIASINEIENSADSRVVRVVIAGFSSPEGSTAVNDRLASGRATAMRDYIVANTPLNNDRVNLHTGGVDWFGLRQHVSTSDMSDKKEILNIIDNIPVWDAAQGRGRLTELKNLSGGRAYRYMLDNIFPDLRNATYIKVYYENK